MAGHPVWRRCSSLTCHRHAHSSRLASRAPRHGIQASPRTSRGPLLRLAARGGPGRVYYEGPIGDYWLSEITVTSTRSASEGSVSRPLQFKSASHSFAKGKNAAESAIDGDPQSGIDALRAFRAHHPDELRVIAALGKVLADEHDSLAAEPLLVRALSEMGDDPDLLHKLADIRNDQDRIESRATRLP